MKWTIRYSFNEVLRHIDLKRYFVEEKDHKTGRPGYDGEKLLKVILFAFMEEGYQALRKMEKLCKTDIRFLWLLDDEPGPGHMTICNFINKRLKGNRYGRTEELYQCEDCSGCPCKGKCAKAAPSGAALACLWLFFTAPHHNHDGFCTNAKWGLAALFRMDYDSDGRETMMKEENKLNYYLAIDIGASSGRHIVGWIEGQELRTREVFRFPNGVKEENGHLIWDVDALLGYVKEGFDRALAEFGALESFSVDTWGVDYVLLRGNEEVRPCYAYRDSRTESVISAVHGKVPFEELYARTGVQFQPFNTVYQLYADKLAGRLEGVTDWLMMPCYLLWKLTGARAAEYTNATTTGLVNAKTGEFDGEIVEKLGLSRDLFPSVQQPGTVVGEYKGVKAVLCATHDTGSAVEGIPMEEDAPYISSGTWSLLGVKSGTAHTDGKSRGGNWSNEGGVGYIRYQKNIMGMWLANELKRELCPDKPFPEIVAEAEQSAFDGLVDANAQDFLAPKSMKAAFDAALDRRPESVGDYFRCAYRSLALSYRDAVEELEENMGKRYEKLYIVGGGAKNAFLNRLTEEATGKTVMALPIEATALGNLRIQMARD